MVRVSICSRYQLGVHVRRSRTSLTSLILTLAVVLSVLGFGALLPGGGRALADPPTGGSAIATETFTGPTVADPAWTAQGSACLTAANTTSGNIPTCKPYQTGAVPTLGKQPGYLQLTDAANSAAGSVLLNRPIPAAAGISVTFDQYQYGGTGADGVGFFLVDGATNLTATGGNGGSLG